MTRQTPGAGDSQPGEPQPRIPTPPQGSINVSDPYRKIALDLQRQLDAVHGSRTWQLALACGLARRSFREMLRLPGRVWRILSGPTGPASEDGLGTSRRAAVRQSQLNGWPADRPLVTAVILSAGDHQAVGDSLLSLRASTLQDFEVVLLHRPVDGFDPLDESLRAAGRPVRTLEAECPDSAAGRNAAVEAAEGKYVALLREGDRLDPTFLETAAGAMEHDPRFGFTYARPAPAEVRYLGRIGPFDLHRALRYNPVADSALFRREAWSEAGGFRVEATFDLWDFWVALGTLGWSGLFLPEALMQPGAESLRVAAQFQEAAEQPAEPERIRLRHTSLLESSPHARPSAASDAPSAVAPAAAAASGLVAFPQRRFLCFGATKPAILCVVPWLDIGGAEQVVLQLIRGLRDQFAFAVVATLPADHNRAAEFRAATPWVYQLPERSAADPGRFLADFAEMHGVRGVLVSSSEAGYQALPALKQRGLWTADIVHNTTPHGYLDRSIARDPSIDFHFACGRVQADALRNAGAVPESRIRTVWTAVDAQATFHPESYAGRREALRAEFGLAANDIVLAYVGRLSIEKDVPLFVAAVSEIVRRNPGLPIRALIAGEGPELLRVEQAIEREGLWNEVRLLGDSRRVPELLAASDYLLLTSRTEGSPITILEAMSLELLVFSTDVGNVRDVIDNGVNGFVVEGRDPAGFADRFGEIRSDSERETRLRQAARRTIVERFEESRMLESYAEVLRAALAQGAR